MEQQQPSIFESGISNELKHELAGAANWAKIVAIIGFTGAALSFMVSLASGQIFTGLISVIIAVIMNVFMFRFGKNTSAAIKTSDQGELIEGFSAIKTYFKISAILILIVFIIVILAIFGGFMGAILGS